MMKITILGAAGGEVTGSCYLVQTSRARVLVDCGLFQGSRDADSLNAAAPVPDPAHLDAVVVTHAHLDHTGRIPVLVRHGFHGAIHATSATIDLMMIILEDSARIQQQDTERLNRKRQRAGDPPVDPLYTPADVEPVRDLTRPAAFHEFIEIAPGIKARYFEAGHMLGSASVELTIEEGRQRKTVVFSGDLGPHDRPVVRDFETLTHADVVLLEATYGDRVHRPYAETVTELESIVEKSVAEGGKMLIPTFAIGRSQQINYHLAVMFREGRVAPFPVFLDSPMAIRATAVYTKHPELYDDEMNEWREQGLYPVSGDHFKPTPSADDSRALNHVPGPCAILAGAGMCNAGRILHHLRQNLWKPETHVLIVGFQGRGTLGRRLVDGEPFVSIHGEKVAVKAHIHTLGGFSAHADQHDLLQWFAPLAKHKPRLYLTHGEDDPRRALAKLIKERHGVQATLPALHEVIEL